MALGGAVTAAEVHDYVNNTYVSGCFYGTFRGADYEHTSYSGRPFIFIIPQRLSAVRSTGVGFHSHSHHGASRLLQGVFCKTLSHIFSIAKAQHNYNHTRLSS